MKCSVWSMPDDLQMSMTSDDSYLQSLKKVCDLPIRNVVTAMWEPNGSQKIVCLSDNNISLIDCNKASEV